MQNFSFCWICMDIDIVTSLGGLPGEELEVLHLVGFASGASEVLS